MHFLLPDQQCQSTEGKISHSMDLLTPSSPGGLPTSSLTTNSSWLPWGRVAMPLISPLMPVPQFLLLLLLLLILLRLLGFLFNRPISLKTALQLGDVPWRSSKVEPLRIDGEIFFTGRMLSQSLNQRYQSSENTEGIRSLLHHFPRTHIFSNNYSMQMHTANNYTCLHIYTSGNHEFYSDSPGGAWLDVFCDFFPARTVCSSKQSGKYSAWTSTITEIGKNSTRKGRSWKIMYTKVHNNQYTRCFLCPRKMIQNLHSLLRWVPATTDCLRRHLPTWLRSIQSN